jgi:hypothetical protein
MTSRGKKIALFVGIGVIATGYFLYARKKNKDEANVILDYISKLPSQVDLSAATEQGIQSIQNIKFDPKRISISGKKGAIDNATIRSEVTKVVKQLHDAIDGLGTSLTPFFDALKRIGNKNTFYAVDYIYKSVYKEGLFEAMKGEFALNNVNYALLSDKTKYNIAIPFLSEGKWHPVFAQYFGALKDY